MPRRGGGGRASPSRGFTRAPARPAQVPAHPPPAAAMHPPQPRQPGLLAQAATTAAGVAVGSAIGHTIGHAMTSGGGEQEVAPAQPAPYQPQDYQQQQPQACGWELKQFLDCAQNQHDLTLCSGFSEALRQCKIYNGIPLQ